MTQTKRYSRGLMIMLATAWLAIACPQEPAPEDLDTSFSTDGKLTTDFGQPDEALAMALQLFDGKILLAGRSKNDFALARYRGGGKVEE